MKFLIKSLIVLLLGASVSTSVAIYAVNKNKDNDSLVRDVKRDGDYYILENDNFTISVDRFDLSFTVKKGDTIWNSGRADPSDEITPLSRLSFLTNPVTIYTYTSAGAESSFSIFDNAHQATTTKAFTIHNNILTASIGVIHGGSRKDPDFKFDFKINYILEEDGLSISISDLNEYESKSTLSRLVIYPGISSSYLLNDGYFLIPDGSGALIDLSKPTHAQSALQLSTYGKDIGISTEQRYYTSPEMLSMPMYAIMDNEKAMMATISEGEEYSTLNSKVSGIIDSYNYTYFSFTFKEMTYQYQGISDSTRKAVPQKEANVFSPKIHYHFYDKPLKYYEIANKYQNYLLSNDLLNKANRSTSNLRLEFLMAENRKSLFGNQTFKTTSVNFINEKASKLMDIGNKFTYSLKGYSRGGFGNSYPYSFPIEGMCGSDNDFRNLATALKQNGISLDYMVDLVRSFSSNGDLAFNMSQKYIESSDYVYGTNLRFNRLKPSSTKRLISEYKNILSSLGGSGFDFTSIGYELFSNYFNENNTRTTSKLIYQDALNEFTGEKNMRKPNQYMWKYCDNYLFAATSSSNFMIETESIPFLQMVLSGYVGIYGDYINLNYLGEKQILTMIDFNVYPNYLLTEADTMDLIESPSSSYIYSSKYETWEENIIDTYNKVINKLSKVEGAKFVSRDKLADNVYLNVYSNKKAIIVNYSTSEYKYGNITVNGLTSEVIDYE